MTNYIRDVDLTVESNLVWRPARTGEKVYFLIVGKSPSGRAKCRKCSQQIQLGELRCGIPIKHSMGVHGRISAWQHLSCTRLEKSLVDDLILSDVIYGLAAFSSDIQEKILQEVVSSEIPEHLIALDPSDLIKRGKLEEEKPPNGLLQHLLPYQKEGLKWMLDQEKSILKGGILADEMGMGKTIQVIALLLAHRVSGPTLVVAPVSSMMQWKTEIEQHVAASSFVVKVVSKTTSTSVEDMENADIVLTTYPIIEQAWRSLVAALKTPCKYCGLLFLPRQLVVHNKYFCGPLAAKTAKQMKRERNDGGTSVAPKNRQKQSKETIAKGLRSLHVNLDEEISGDVQEEGPSSCTAHDATNELSLKRTIMGPIGMYQELMREAGRKVRSRWEGTRRTRRRSGKNSDDDSSFNETTSNDDESDTEPSDSEMEKDVAIATEEIEKIEEETRQRRFLCFTCESCKFQKLRFPFCPMTGQHHVISDELRSTIQTDTGGDEVNLQNSPFHRISWARIVLDEAHRIKERTTSTARSSFALTAEYRWCLTGTPLQNRVGDVYSLLRFLRLKPYCNYFCSAEGCSCSSLSHPFSGTSLRQCVFCGHGPLQHYAFFNKHILNPITRYGYIGDGRLGMMQLHEVFSNIMLRRTKTERADDLHLPSLTIEKVYIDLTEEERNFYESLYKKCTVQFNTFVSKGTVLHNYAHIFQLLSRLRQALDHPLLVVRGMDVGKVHYQDGLCGICGEGLEGDNNIKVDPCNHGFHRVCLGQFLESAPEKKFHCPICFTTINVDLRHLRVDTEDNDVDAGEIVLAALPPELEDEELVADEDNFGALQGSPTTNSPRFSPVSTSPLDSSSVGSSKSKPKTGVLARLDTSKPLAGSKLNAIVKYVLEIPKQEKIIVFSQFGEMLDLMQYAMERRGIKAVKLCGSLSLSQRQSVLLAFQSEPSVKVILISLKAGGEGLNLQNANHVILVDPWWNPAVEMQAVQRAHRIGQQKPVHAVRYVTRDSMEERMVELQDKKLLVFEGTIDGAVNSLKKLTSDDLQFLFTR